MGWSPLLSSFYLLEFTMHWLLKVQLIQSCLFYIPHQKVEKPSYWHWDFFTFYSYLFLGECDVWGDPHYTTFGGLSYDFFGNCTYTLVEEKIPKYNFSVLVDNYFCIPFIKNSCPKGLIISYNGNVVHISTGREYVVSSFTLLPIF